MANIQYELHEQIPGFTGTEPDPLIVYKTLAGINICVGETVPTGAGYAPGCLFIHNDGSESSTMYKNYGDATTADFEEVLDVNNVVTQIQAEYNAAAAAGIGPSPAIWDDAKTLEVMLDPSKGFMFFDHYLGPIDVTNDDAWDIDTVNSGAINGVADGEGGQLLVDTDGHNAEADGIQAQLTNCAFKAAANRVIRFEARVKMADTGIDSYYVGLAATLGATAAITNGAVDDTVDKCGFYRLHGSTADKICSIASRTSADDATADVGSIADGTFVNLGFVITGLTSVKFYVNGTLVETGTTTASLPNAAMALIYSAKCGQTSTDAELTIDWVRILQEGVS